MLDTVVISGEDVCCSVTFSTLVVVSVCINDGRYVCCSECYASNECDEPTPALCNLSVRTVVKLCIFGVLVLGVSLVPEL